MNQELLSVGSKRRRTGGSVRGNASSSQADEEQMNRVVEEEEQQQEEHIVLNGEIDGDAPGSLERNEPHQEHLEENNNSCTIADQESADQPGEHELSHQDEDEDEEACDAEDEEEMDQDSDDFEQSDDSSREEEHRNGNDIPNSNSMVDMPINQQSICFNPKSKVSANVP
ncbi:hypothetical protein XELAEV_18009226mg, partial [Xenopus laevis]